jgi:hypothetical protein
MVRMCPRGVNKKGVKTGFLPGSMYIADFVRELKRLQISIDKEEMEQMNKLADSTGKVWRPNETIYLRPRSRKLTMKSTPTTRPYSKHWTRIRMAALLHMRSKARQKLRLK